MELLNNTRITEENSGLRPEITQSICSLAEKYKVELVVLFGSRARGDFREKSDIDLAVSGGNFQSFCLETDEETPTLLKYNFINLNENVSENLIEQIKKDGRILYSEK